MTETIGIIGALLFAFCALPGAIQSYKQKHSRGMNWLMLGMWFSGVSLTMTYVLLQEVILWPLIFHYVIKLPCLVVIMWYKLVDEVLE